MSTLCLGVSSDSAGPSADISKLGDVYISLDRGGASLERETERELITMILVRESFSRSCWRAIAAVPCSNGIHGFLLYVYTSVNLSMLKMNGEN